MARWLSSGTCWYLLLWKSAKRAVACSCWRQKDASKEWLHQWQSELKPAIPSHKVPCDQARVQGVNWNFHRRSLEVLANWPRMGPLCFIEREGGGEALQGEYRTVIVSWERTQDDCSRCGNTHYLKHCSLKINVELSGRGIIEVKWSEVRWSEM
jgi:hypothetical protein